MSKIKTISRTFSKTIQEKDYEPIHISATITADLEENDNAIEESKNLFKYVVEVVGVDISNAIWEKWTNPAKAVRKLNKPNVPF